MLPFYLPLQQQKTDSVVHIHLLIIILYQVENSSLTQKLEELEVRSRRGQKKTSEEASQILQVETQSHCSLS